MASDEKGNELVGNACISKPLSVLGILAVKHGGEQVLSITRVLLAVGNNLVGDIAHGLDVLFVLVIGGAIEELGCKWRAAATGAALCQEIAHGLDKGMELLAVVRVETIVHGAEGNCVEGETGKVVGGVDAVTRVAGKLHGHLRSNVVHLVKHVSNGQGTKGRNENAMRFAPVRFSLGVGGKEAVVNGVANLAKRTGNGLFEATLIAGIVYKLSGAHDAKGAAA